jgi:inner membrane protein
MKFPMLGKTVAIGAVTVGLIVALQIVSGIVGERQGRLAEAHDNVAASLATAQTLTGPVLHRQCTESRDVVKTEDKVRTVSTETRSFSVLVPPHRLAVDGGVTMEPRHRGLFRVNGYLARATLTAHWPSLDALRPAPERTGGRVQCEAPVMFVGVADARGIRSARVSIDGQEAAVAPGTTHGSHARGFHSVLSAAQQRPGDASLQAVVRLDLVGTDALSFAPVGDNTEVRLAADWPHPSFGGRFLPNERELSDSAFSARWALSALATSAQQALREGAAPCGERRGNAECIETFGVSFIDPVSPSVLSDRATKYGLLFIVLTFVAVGLVEVLRQLRVHPVQYGLVGCALVVFFLLLVSLTEHLPFAVAYAAASAACTLLLAFYGRYVLGGWRAGALFGAGIGLLYGMLYVLLQLEQMSLVLGSVMLFAVLAAVMVVTRKLDWYALAAPWRGAPPAAAQA